MRVGPVCLMEERCYFWVIYLLLGGWWTGKGGRVVGWEDGKGGRVVAGKLGKVCEGGELEKVGG